MTNRFQTQDKLNVFLTHFHKAMSTSVKEQTNEIEISCDIPYDLPNYTCIQYPGQVNNIENALETLGGNDKIQQTFTKFNQFQAHKSGKQKKDRKEKKPKEPYLQLHLNPNGVFDHALFGKIRNVKNCILLKKTTKIAKKKKSKKRKFDQITPKTKIEVLGRITSMVTYDELCDFQVFSELKYPKKAIIISDQSNTDSNHTIHKSNKRRRIWSLREDDIPNVSKYPLVPRVFASKAVPYDDILKHSANKSIKGSPKPALETKPTEIMFKKKEVPTQPKPKSQWLQWLKDLNAYVSDANNRKIPQKSSKDKAIKTVSFCRKIRNELVLQIKAYFAERPIWTKTEILLQKFYIHWYYIKYFADRIEVTTPQKNESNTFYDFDIASIVFERKQKKNFYLSKTKTHCKDHTLDNSDKISLNFKEKQRIVSKFLGVIGYKFQSGPFRNSFIKFGFDPRKSENKALARPLQILDYRIHKSIGRKLGINTEWSGGRVSKRGKPSTQHSTAAFAHIASLISNEQRNKESKASRTERFLAHEMGMNNEESKDENAELESEIRDRLQFKAKPNKLQVYYQMRNIDISEVKAMIYNKDLESFNSECVRDCGWISKKNETKIRELMHARLEVWIAERAKQKREEKMIGSLMSKRKEKSEEMLDMTELMGGESSPSLNVNENEDEKIMELDEDMTFEGNDLSQLFDGDLDGAIGGNDDMFDIL